VPRHASRVEAVEVHRTMTSRPLRRLQELED
jgi:hypothetical protein